MGAWGTGLYSDDVACDVRDRYRQLVGAIGSGKEATKRLREEFQDALCDPDEKPVVLLALADTQWRLDRLESTIRRQALTIIERGTDLRRWKEENPNLIEKRCQVLEKLKNRLLEEPPAPRKISAPFRQQNPWTNGDVIAYQRRNGKLALLRVAGTFRETQPQWMEAGEEAPIVEILSWQGKRTPAEERIRELQVRPDSNGRRASVLFFLSQRGLSSRRFIRMGIRTNAEYRVRREERVNVTIGALSGERLDEDLAIFFGMR